MSIEKIKAGDELTTSKDLVKENIEKLRELFPEVITEGRIDFKVLQQVLGEEIEEGEEYYRFTWAGKSQARREAHKPSTGTLRPAKDESVDWDTTQNLYIEGDNLEVLKLLQKSYAGKVKMIYIDPPYNTGKDFVYKDNYKDNLKNYQQVTGQIDSEGNKLSTNSESEGRFHSNWLNMISPRLYLARNLLRQDGVIFISIGKEENSNLQKLCNEIFGEENQIGVCTRLMKSGGNSGKFFSPNVEYILVYAKNPSVAQGFKDDMDKSLIKKVYTATEKEGSRRGEKYRTMGLYQASLTLERSRNARYFIECPDGTKCIPPKGKRWRVIEESYNEMLEKGDIEFKATSSSPLFDEDGNKSNWNIYTKIWLKDRQEEGRIPTDFIGKYENRHSSKELQSINIPFEFAKPTELVKYLLKIAQTQAGIVLDFFAGSSTTAHAMLELNKEDNGNRRFIMVQLPEPTSEKSDAFNAGFLNIAEIGKERIRRAARKIAEENQSKAKELDLGFKVFKLDTSNIKSWDGNPENLKNSLWDTQDNIKEGRAEEDVLYEILLKYGLDLTLPIKERKIEGLSVFNVGYGALFVCLGNNITNKVAEGIGKWKEEVKPETCRVIFKDSGFNDVEKTNAAQTLKRFGIHEIKSI